MELEIIRHFDKLGRIVIPVDFRRSMGITEDTEILLVFNSFSYKVKKPFLSKGTSRQMPALTSDFLIGMITHSGFLKRWLSSRECVG